ncbi:MAG: (2Fe-2S)-binding protein [Actinomycetota bacterium]|nr:(2Fe-2S)-binding protein [Actinomycetota bacterium]
MQVTMSINGQEHSHDVEPRMLLVHYIREMAELHGTHWGCDTSNCGICVVLMNGEPVKSCTTLAAQAEGNEITTCEGLMKEDGTLDPIQMGFYECHGLQCGFCTPGMMVTGNWLIENHPNPTEMTEEDIRMAISGGLCRCTGYKNIVAAIRWAAAYRAGETPVGLT